MGDDDFWKAVDDATDSGDVRAAHTRAEGKWTILPVQLSGSRQAGLLLAGDWRLAGQSLTAFGEQLTAAFRSPTPSAAGLRRASHRLARRLSKTQGMTPVCTAVVEAMAAAVRARLAAIAIVDPADRRLSIKATYGYPLMLVEHMRIEPGEGVFGFAFETGKVLRVPGSANGLAPKPLRRRPRYRTDSFIALPILAGDDVLAVVCVADRVDDRTFTRSDVSALRALAAPAALALARERAAARAEAYAHAAAVDPVSGLFNRRLLSCPSRRGTAALATARDSPRAPDDGHRRLQGRQRPVRPPGRRWCDQGDRGDRPPRRARVRRVHAIWRRRVRRHHARQQRRERHGGG